MTGVNLIEWDSAGVPWRPAAPTEVLQEAADRWLTEDHDDGHDCD